MPMEWFRQDKPVVLERLRRPPPIAQPQRTGPPRVTIDDAHRSNDFGVRTPISTTDTGADPEPYIDSGQGEAGSVASDTVGKIASGERLA